MKFVKVLTFGAVLTIAASACKKDEPVTPTPPPADTNTTPVTYTVPETYNFANVSYSGQTTRIAMLNEISTEMRKGTSEQVDAQVLKNMYANIGDPFVSADLNAATVDIKSKVYSLDQAIFETYFDKIDAASNSPYDANVDTAGVITSSDGTKKYLVDENGVEWAQVVLKRMMGALMYYQAVGGYLTDEKIGDHIENTTAVEGKGTTMEHHWDEAFGYFGVPVNFPTNPNGTQYWGSYSKQRDAQLGSNKKMMDAFLTGRAAISNKDMATKNAQRDIIVAEWEKIAAASAVHYLNDLKTQSDQAVISHHASEALGFVHALKYNPSKKISQTQIDQVVAYLGDDFYNININDINSAISLLNSVYGF